MVLANKLDELRSKQSCQRKLQATDIYSVVSPDLQNNIDKSIYMYDLNSEDWNRIASVQYSVAKNGDYIFANDHVFLVGGEGATLPLKSINIYTGATKAFKSMLPNRKEMALAHYDNKIFSFGGESDGTVLEIVAS